LATADDPGTFAEVLGKETRMGASHASYFSNNPMLLNCVTHSSVACKSTMFGALQ